MGLQNIKRGFRCVVALAIAAVSSTSVAVAKKPVEKKTFVDSLIFNYENSIWGKTPAVPLQPLKKTERSTLKDLSNYGVFEDAPLLSTDRTIFVDSTYKIQLHTTKREVLQGVDESHSHVGVGVSFGPTWMTYKSEFGDGEMSLSPSVHAMYDYYFNHNWGFMVGASFSFTTGTFAGKNYSDTYSYVEYEGDRLNFNYKVGEIKEINKLLLLDVPITVSYTHGKLLGGKLFGHAGLKVGVPIKLKYDQTLKDCDFTCEIPAYNVTMNHGAALGLNDKECKYSGQFLSNPIMVMFTADAGYRFRINDMFSINAGVFFDKALYRIKFKANSDEDNIQYEKKREVYDFLKTSNPKDQSEIPVYLMHSSVLSGQKISTKQRIAESLGYTSVGLKITFTFDRYGKDYYSSEENDESSVESASQSNTVSEPASVSTTRTSEPVIESTEESKVESASEPANEPVNEPNSTLGE